MMIIGVVTNLIIGEGLSTITGSLSWAHLCGFQGKRYFDRRSHYVVREKPSASEHDI